MALKNYAYYTNEQDLKIHISAILSGVPSSNDKGIKLLYKDKNQEFSASLDSNTHTIFTATINGRLFEGGKIYNFTPSVYGKEYDPITIVPSFEFARLISIDKNGNERMLPLKYNVDISGLKPNVADVITPTLGGKYPFIRRNGAQDYDSFSLNGLICLETERDDANKIMSEFFTGDEIGELNTYAAQVNKGISEYDYKIIIERYYREKILNFLKEPTVKLFKSMTEGDKFVYLSNISLTPDKVSGRALYSFSCQATEVGGNYDMVVKTNGTED